MKIQKKNEIKARSISFIYRLINKLENKNDANFKTNGEENFIKDALSYYGKNNNAIVIFDVGASTGGYSDIISEKISKKTPFTVHLFEPIKSCFTIIKNKFNQKDNFILNNFGVSDEKKEATIYFDKEGSELTSLYKRNLDAFHVKMDKTKTVTLERMDNYIRSKNITKINILKIDIEGHELAAFRGLGKYLHYNFIDFIQFEYGGCNIDSNTTLYNLYEILEKSGFIICKIMPKYLEIKKYTKSIEDYTYANYVAISKNIFHKVQ